MNQVLPFLLGGLGLFLYSIYKLSEILKSTFSEKAKEIIKKSAKYTLTTILLGTVLTILLDSSSAVIIMVIVFINSKVLTFRQSMGFILGANIGTTFSSKIIAMNVGQYSFIVFLVGLFLMLFIKNKKIKNISAAVMYFGMLFFGLYIIETSVLPLHDSELFTKWMASVENNAINGSLIGGLITLIIQSSSATVGMIIILGKQDIISLSAGLAIMLGAELGTCSDTLIATIRGSRQAIKAGLFHFIFSLVTIAIALLLFTPFVDLIKFISRSQDIGNQIANGHVLFNVLGVLICLPFLNQIEKVFNKLIPEKIIPIPANLKT